MSASNSLLSPLTSRISSTWSNPSGRIVLVSLLSSAVTASAVLTHQSLRRASRRRELKNEIEQHMRSKKKDYGIKDETDLDAMIGDRQLGEDDYEEADVTLKALRGRSQSFLSKLGIGGLFGGDLGEKHVGENIVGIDGNASASSSNRGRKSSVTNKKKLPVAEPIIREQLARNIAFLGDEGVKKVRDSFVVVIGLGGVGAAAATMLCRSGVGKIRLVDFDLVTLSSLNRHSVATLDDVGTPKVNCCAKHFSKIAPWVNVDPVVALYGGTGTEEPDVLEGNPDWVLDAIDNVETKVQLLKECCQRGIKVFSAMGAGSKSDPARIQFGDISATNEDPLARSIRRKLRLQGVNSEIPVVYSTERPNPSVQLLPLSQDEFKKGNVNELSSIEKFRVRILPVLGTLPCMFGQAAATYIICKLSEFPMETLPLRNRPRLYQKLHQTLWASERKLTGNNHLPFTETDLQYAFEEIHRARSCIPPNLAPYKAVILRWDKRRPLHFDNLIVLDQNEALRHEEHCLRGDTPPGEYWGPEVDSLMETRFAEERAYRTELQVNREV